MNSLVTMVLMDKCYDFDGVERSTWHVDVMAIVVISIFFVVADFLLLSSLSEASYGGSKCD
jgi:hypothetical protein